MQITIHDTNELSELDLRVLHALVGGEAPSAPVSGAKAAATPEAKAPAAKAAPKAEKAAPAKAEPVEADEPEEDVADEPTDEAPAVTKKDAVALATKLVSEGQAANVKAVLTKLGAKRVSELEDKDVPAFIAELS